MSSMTSKSSSVLLCLSGLLLVFLVLGGACSSDPPATDACISSAECASGLCVDGTCADRDSGPGDGATDPGPDPAADGDGDGISDIDEGRYEPAGAVDTDGDGTPDYLDDDSDGDGIPDMIEGGDRPSPATPPRDTDRDGTADFRDDDSDGDGLTDAFEGGSTPPDTDGDGIPDFLDRDSDGDGLLDAQEAVPAEADGTPPDTDGDGLHDFRDLDTDDDGLLDEVEGLDDWDGDGVPNFRDPTNDGAVPSISLTAISTTFNNPIGIDYHEPTNSIVMTVNYPTGVPFSFERIEFDGTHEPFSDVTGFTEEVKIGTIRSGNLAGFVTGDLFVGNGVDGQIARITDGGATVMNPWVTLPGTGHGLLRGSFAEDRTGIFGGDLIAVTDAGEIWRIDAAGTPTMLAAAAVHLEGLAVVPDASARFGPLAGHIISGAEAVSMLYAIGVDGVLDSYPLAVAIEDIDIVPPRENFFGVNYGTGQLLGAPASEFESIIGDIVLTQEIPTTTGAGLFRLLWDGYLKILF